MTVPPISVSADGGEGVPDFRDRALEWLAEAAMFSGRPPVWLDAATGAGNMTLRAARRLSDLGGTLLSVDIDPASWTDWAAPKLRGADLLDRVQFQVGDLLNLSWLGLTVDAVICDTTLSTMGIPATAALLEWSQVLAPGGRVVIYDYLPQASTTDADQDLANHAWRLYKAVEVLSGRPHYEEVDPTHWLRLLAGQGYRIDCALQDPRPAPRSRESLAEWLETSLDLSAIPDQGLRAAIAAADQEQRRAVRARGAMPRWSGTFLIMAEAPRGGNRTNSCAWRRRSARVR